MLFTLLALVPCIEGCFLEKLKNLLAHLKKKYFYLLICFPMPKPEQNKMLAHLVENMTRGGLIRSKYINYQ